jgi:DNA repair protein RAD5
MACRQCILQHIEVSPTMVMRLIVKFQRQRGEDPICHTCRTPISETSIFDVIRHTSEVDSSTQITLQHYSPTQSTELDALVRHLRLLCEQEPLTKSVVFSQFTSFLDIVERTLKHEKVQFLRLDGTTSQPQRAAVLEKFSSHKGRLVLLISLKARGVGLNLAAASRVFMLDPWWSFAVEAQAIDQVCSAFCGWEVNGRFIEWDRISRFLLQGLLLRIQWRRRC